MARKGVVTRSSMAASVAASATPARTDRLPHAPRVLRSADT